MEIIQQMLLYKVNSNKSSANKIVVHSAWQGLLPSLISRWNTSVLEEVWQRKCDGALINSSDWEVLPFCSA